MDAKEVMIRSEDFPVLGRSRRLAPKTLAILNRVSTLIVRRSRTTESLLAEIGELDGSEWLQQVRAWARAHRLEATP